MYLWISYLNCAILVTSKSYPQAHMALTRWYGSYPQVIHRVIHRPPNPNFPHPNPHQRFLGLMLIILYRELSHFSIYTAAISRSPVANSQRVFIRM